MSFVLPFPLSTRPDFKSSKDARPETSTIQHQMKPKISSDQPRKGTEKYIKLLHIAPKYLVSA